MDIEEGVRAATDRTICVPESVYLAIQKMGLQLTSFDARSGRRRVDLRRAMPVCMVLADNDVERAAILCQDFADALEDWNRVEVGQGGDFIGQPVP